jgi:hypothetical protein
MVIFQDATDNRDSVQEKITTTTETRIMCLYTESIRKKEERRKW